MTPVLVVDGGVEEKEEKRVKGRYRQGVWRMKFVSRASVGAGFLLTLTGKPRDWKYDDGGAELTAVTNELNWTGPGKAAVQVKRLV